MESTRLQNGTVIAGKYRIDSLLGEGGMGSVYRAEHLVLKAPVALKVIDRELAEGDVALARFIREAQAAASLRSPHVVQVIDYGTEGERPYMVMELLEGESLADRLKRVGPLSAGETYRVLSHVARAVAKAHEAGIVHRDLKPDNVFLVHNEGDEVAKVLDFGVAKVDSTQLDGSGHTRTGSLLGTPYYMSPEQAQGNKEIDGRSDLWALGVIAFECLVGTRPFESEGLGDLVLQICIREIPEPSKVYAVPAGFDAWFKLACARELNERFQTARELSEALFGALGLRDAPHLGIRESKWSSFAVAPSQAHSNAKRQKVPEAPLPPGVRAEQPSEATTVEKNQEQPSNTNPHKSGALDSTASPVSSSGRASHWQVVPHGQLEEGVPQIQGLPERSVWGASIYGIIFLALTVGGGAMYLAEINGYLDQVLFELQLSDLEEGLPVAPEKIATPVVPVALPEVKVVKAPSPRSRRVPAKKPVKKRRIQPASPAEQPVTIKAAEKLDAVDAAALKEKGAQADELKQGEANAGPAQVSPTPLDDTTGVLVDSSSNKKAEAVTLGDSSEKSSGPKEAGAEPSTDKSEEDQDTPDEKEAKKVEEGPSTRLPEGLLPTPPPPREE